MYNRGDITVQTLIIAARFHKIRKKLKDIVNIVHIQEVTLRKRLMEFGDTPSSSLTTDEFLTVDLGEEQDPPSFKAARLKDKERLQKYTDVEYEMKMQKLQRLIEKELEKKRARGKRTSSVCSVDTETDATADDMSDTRSTCSVLKDILGDNLDDENEINDAVVQTTLESIDKMCSKIKDVEPSSSSLPKGLGPTLETIGMSSSTSNENGGEMETVPNEETQSTSETPVESAKTSDISLDDLDDEELNSYIVTEEEFQQKQKAWQELYATFLEEQKRKEEEKSTKEKEDGKQDKKRKRAKRTKTAGAATAGEAVEKVLREKKISNKLNYDVLKSLNMNDFVKSMNFSSVNGMKEVEAKIQEANSKKSTPENEKVPEASSSEKVFEDDLNEDEVDEADDFEEEAEPDRMMSLTDMLRANCTNEDDNEDYDY